MMDYNDRTSEIHSPELLAEEIIRGRRLGRGEDLGVLLSCPLDGLCRGADRIRAAFCGEKVDLCTIINGKSGRCNGDCKFCAQSAHNCTDIETYGFLDPQQILAEGKAHETQGVDRFAIVTAGEVLPDEDFSKALMTFRLLRDQTDLQLCASMGLLSVEQLVQLKEAGVFRYHENLETSRRNFPNICTTHTFDDKIRTIRAAQSAGLSVCSGGIIGMGESWEDRLDMALSLAELGVDSVPVNVLTPIPGTPFEGLPILEEPEILRTIAIFRYIIPQAHIRFAAGRNRCENAGAKVFESGLSAAITGDMLTTTGSTTKKDRQMLTALGRVLNDTSMK